MASQKEDLHQGTGQTSTQQAIQAILEVKMVDEAQAGASITEAPAPSMPCKAMNKSSLSRPSAAASTFQASQKLGQPRSSPRAARSSTD